MTTAQATSNKAMMRRFVDAANSDDAELLFKTVDELVDPDAGSISFSVAPSRSLAHRRVRLVRSAAAGHAGPTRVRRCSPTARTSNRALSGARA
jgi:hypothetical protein